MSGVMEGDMKETGRKIRCKDMVCLHGQMEESM